MSTDLPVEEPARRLTAARASHVWERTFLPWDAYFAVAWAATEVFVLGTSDPGPALRITAAVLLALLVPWYVAAGRPVITAKGDDERRATVYLVGAVALFLAASWIVGETRLATFVLAPQCFMLLRMRRALVFMSVIVLAPVLGWALIWHPGRQVVFFNTVFAVASLAFSVFFGTWITKVLEQSQERAVLIAELDASREEVARLSTAHGALAERERMSREIHDTLAQGFTSLLMLIQVVEAEVETDLPGARRHLELMAATTRQNLAEARALVAGGAPADLDGSSLPDAVRRLAARHAEQTGAAAEVTVAGTVQPLPPGLEVVALRTCQESLANARKHAGPGTPVTITLAYADTALTVSVKDTGRGFDPRVPNQGYGLSGLRARASEVGGTALVHSAVGEGTTVTVSLRSPR
ncbi:sensor histidine kinase [Streptomyces sp. NBC_01465]|uniref:sensor histidine kinase n=1 Tax=Streptomyces sp. NBC_01465 TaxID=2903878 RepID=UPI002E30CC36|nr:sensor histidine kinase [Streptomyces sp. NBC_01465]